MMRTFLTAAFAAGLSTAASAGFIVEVDVDGSDAGNVGVFGPNFSLGGDTSTVSFRGAPSQTPGVVGIRGGNSIFGGNGTSTDTYIYTYTPGTDGDNEAFSAGQFLNTRGATTSGLAAGSTGNYDIYALWLASDSISGGPSVYTLADAGSTLFTASVDQNNVPNGSKTDWVFIGSAALDAGTTYTLTQEPTSNTFVSQRAHSVLFEATSIVPEPASAVLALGGLGLLAGRRRR